MHLIAKSDESGRMLAIGPRRIPMGRGPPPDMAIPAGPCAHDHFWSPWVRDQLGGTVDSNAPTLGVRHACVRYLRGEFAGIYLKCTISNFEKLHPPRARGVRARARAACESRRDESTVNNSGSSRTPSKIKFSHTHPVGNLLLFPSMGRGTCESTYARRKS